MSYGEGVTVTAATRTGQIYEVLRSELLNGVLHPGQKLKVAEFVGRFGVSQSVIREALTRLTEQGLLVAAPQRGIRVRGLSIDDIAELTETRVQVESLALRLAIERGDLQWETGILAAHHRLERTPVLRDDGTVSEDWSLQHRDFHRALLTGCHNRRLESVANSLRDSAELYRRWYWVLTDDHQRDIAREHRQLKEFALARDAGRAIEVLAGHIDRGPSQLIAYAREHGVDNLTPSASHDQLGNPDRGPARSVRVKRGSRDSRSRNAAGSRS
jgi:DNA-binding GntR family transcriptional regulator